MFSFFKEGPYCHLSLSCLYSQPTWCRFLPRFQCWRACCRQHPVLHICVYTHIKMCACRWALAGWHGVEGEVLFTFILLLAVANHRAFGIDVHLSVSYGRFRSCGNQAYFLCRNSVSFSRYLLCLRIFICVWLVARVCSENVSQWCRDVLCAMYILYHA